MEINWKVAQDFKSDLRFQSSAIMALQEASEGNVYETKVQGYEKQFKTPFFKGMKTLLFLGTSETNSKGMKNSWWWWPLYR